MTYKNNLLMKVIFLWQNRNVIYRFKIYVLMFHDVFRNDINAAGQYFLKCFGFSYHVKVASAAGTVIVDN